MVGLTISHYEVIEKLGEGGMGIVYKARDTRLNRFVAIKVLPPERVADPERKRRFMQEARSASALSHPHIVTIHDIDSDHGADFIAMEYLEGKTLKQMIPPKGLTPRGALNYAVQVADALAAAHAKGIVHRDIKPGNVMVTPGGLAKVLDFGLAKLVERSAGEDTSTLSMSEWTADGVVLGTVAYMSPEQAEGRPVDARSDIFSFGVMFHQMLTGQLPFHRANPLLTIEAIRFEEAPSLSHMNPAVSPELERVVARCLEKDPARRFQSASDLEIVLDWLRRDPAPVQGLAAEPAVRRNRRSIKLPLAVTALAVGATAAAVYWLRQPAAVSPLNAVRMTTSLGLTCMPAVSPDGKVLAYASDRAGDGILHIWVQQLSHSQPKQATRGAADEMSPRFSPDGGSIVFQRRGAGIFAIPVFGESDERQIAPGGLDPQFSPDGAGVAYWVGDQDSSVTSGAVFVTPFVQYAPKRLAAGFIDARYPLWAPDGKHVLFQGVRSAGDLPEWWVAPVDGGAPIDTGILAALRSRHVEPVPGPGDWKGNSLVFSAADPANWPWSDGWLLSRHIWRAAIKMPGWRLAHPPEQLTGGSGVDSEPALAAADGPVVFSICNYHNNLWRLPLRNGEPTQPSVERLSETGAVQSRPAVSANGRTLAFLSSVSGDRQVWIRDLETGMENQLTFGLGNKSAPAVSAEGTTVAYSVVENHKPSIYLVPATSSSAGFARKVCADCGEPSDWMHTSEKILYSGGQPQMVSLLDPASGLSVPLLRHPVHDIEQAHISPDDQWIAFVARDDPNPTRIYLARLLNGAAAGPAEWIPITDGKSQDAKPRWIDDDSLLYYSDRDNFGCLWKQRLRPGNKQPWGAPIAVHHFHRMAQSPRLLFRESFQIAVTRKLLILNLVDLTGDIWTIRSPGSR